MMGAPLIEVHQRSVYVRNVGRQPVRVVVKPVVVVLGGPLAGTYEIGDTVRDVAGDGSGWQKLDGHWKADLSDDLG